MTRYVVFVAMILSIQMIAKKGIEAAFLRVWIPFFLVMPTSFWVDIPGLPDPNFMQAAILPILYVLFRDRKDQMQFGSMEWLLLAYFAVRIFCDFLSRGYANAQNYAFYMLSSLLGPYLLGRYVINSRRMDIETSRMFVLVFLLFFPAFLYEAKFWVSPIYKLFGGFFPNAFSGLSIRWGFARTAGTFEHPILACIMIVVVYRLHRWISWCGVWEQAQTGWLGVLQKYSKWSPLPFRHQISIVLIFMALMTISRGPWIGALVGAGLVMVGNTKDRKSALTLFGVFLLLGGLGAQMALDAYLTPKEGAMLSESAQTMLYRKIMIEQYKEFLFERQWTGWGLTTVPQIPGMESVDNAFFLMALQHGILAPMIFLMIFLYAIISQLAYGLKSPAGASPLGFTFSGVYLACLIAFSTVYMGAQTEPILFLLLGWGEGLKNRREHAAETDPEPGGVPAPRWPFRRVLL
jgi:hypothetical protein